MEIIGGGGGVEITSKFLKLAGVEKIKYFFTHKELRMQLRINIQFHCSDYTVEDLENEDKISFEESKKFFYSLRSLNLHALFRILRSERATFLGGRFTFGLKINVGGTLR